MIDKLKKHSFFNVFPEEALKSLVPHIKTEDYRKSSIIFEEGYSGKSMYIIDSGKVKISKKGRVLCYLGPGEMFGEMSLFGADKRSASAATMEYTTLYKIDDEDFRKFIFEHSEHGLKFMFNSIKEVSRRLRETSGHFITVFETGKIIAVENDVKRMSERIIETLLENLNGGFCGGMIVVYNKFTGYYDVAYERGGEDLTLENAELIIKRSSLDRVRVKAKNSQIFGVRVKGKNEVSGYLFMEKKSREGFSSNEEVIISAVGRQIGFGLLKAYIDQDETAQRRLYERKMRGV